MGSDTPSAHVPSPSTAHTSSASATDCRGTACRRGGLSTNAVDNRLRVLALVVRHVGEADPGTVGLVVFVDQELPRVGTVAEEEGFLVDGVEQACRYHLFECLRGRRRGRGDHFLGQVDHRDPAGALTKSSVANVDAPVRGRNEPRRLHTLALDGLLHVQPLHRLHSFLDLRAEEFILGADVHLPDQRPIAFDILQPLDLAPELHDLVLLMGEACSLGAEVCEDLGHGRDARVVHLGGLCCAGALDPAASVYCSVAPRICVQTRPAIGSLVEELTLKRRWQLSSLHR